jgi:hypothetical protein
MKATRGERPKLQRPPHNSVHDEHRGHIYLLTNMMLDDLICVTIKPDQCLLPNISHSSSLMKAEG